MKRVLFTIICSNYLAHAGALYNSAKKHLKDTELLVYILDCDHNEKARIAAFAESREIHLPSGFIDCLRFSDDINRIDVSVRKAIYSTTELCTSVKASIFLELISEFGKEHHFSYVDPDIEFYSDCSSFFAESEKHPLYLIPHFLEPPEDDFLPNALTILSAGIYNFGYLGVNPAKGNVSEALLWWERRLEKECNVNVESQIFVDQKWGSFLADHPGAGICLSPEYNTAYWNLHERHIAKISDTFTASKKPLGFFHFSGYDPTKPMDMSKHQTRFSLKALPKAYKELFLSHAEKLMSFGYDRWQSFKPLKEPDSVIKKPGPLKDLFLPGLYRSPEDIARMKPLKAAVWTSALVLRKHIQLARVFIKTLFRNGLRRAVTDTAGQYILCAKRSLKMLSASSHPPLLAPRPSTNRSKFAVIGYFSDESGMGEGGRSVANAVFEISDDCCLYDISETSYSRKLADHKHKDHVVSLTGQDQADTLIVAVNADRVNSIINCGYDMLFQKAKKKIGYWWWETEDFPRRWIYACYYFDEIWVATDFIKRSLEKVIPIPVKLVPPLLNLDIQASRTPIPSIPDLKGESYLLTIFDGYSIIHRKNPFGALAAFKAASKKLSPSNNPHLLIKAINISLENRQELEEELHGHRFSIISDYISKEELLDLIGNCTALISLHRSEGLGLNMIDAMLLEKPVIATKYSGNLDFMNKDNSYLIDGKYVETTMKHGVYQGSRWMEPDIDQAAEAIYDIFTSPEKAAEIGKRARSDILKQYSRADISKRVAQALQRQT
jgi:glycosyltransferase involved in cell wall biosynthesis